MERRKIKMRTDEQNELCAAMSISPNWRVLTVGDGDLSFSWSLWYDMEHKNLVATVYDSQKTLIEKYSNNRLRDLLDANCPVYTEVDVTDPARMKALGEIHKFDCTIFQFPLLPSFRSQKDYLDNCLDINTRNRSLLRDFLCHSYQYLLDTNGPQICYITSKDTHPYSDWNIENTLSQGTHVQFLGQFPFEIDQFPGYLIRNVDRDMYVEDTRGTTYVWSSREKEAEARLILKDILKPSRKHASDCCSLCGVGPFTSQQNRDQHKQTKRHQRLQKYEGMWQEHLKSI